MSEWLPEGMEYDADGDVIDRRDNKIRTLKNELIVLKARVRKEEEKRADHPALQDAWDKYQTVLRIVDNT